MNKNEIISGVGFFSDAYDLFIINIVLLILDKVYNINSGDSSTISSAALVGSIIGQLSFGLLADHIGRKKGFIITLSLVIIGAILSSISFSKGIITIVSSLAFFRFILGIGIGGEYPLSATITSESSNDINRGRMVSSVFSMQGVGSLVASLIGFILIITLGTKYKIIWRLCLGLGAVPGILSLYFRITMEETNKFVANQKYQNLSKLSLFKKSFKDYGMKLLGTASCWFILDVTLYANALFSSTLLKIFEVGKNAPGYEVLLETSRFNVILAVIALPGYWFGIFLIDLKYFGRKNTQFFGFLFLGILYFIIGATYTELKTRPDLFILLYGLTFFLTNAGPNTTTFVIPSETFPTKIRATYHGISAASGKLGAALGAIGMAPILNTYGISIVLYICGSFAITGAILTFFLIKETKGLALDLLDENFLPEEQHEIIYSNNSNDDLEYYEKEESRLIH